MNKKINKPPLIVVLGPTASGKSDIAVRLALYLNSRSSQKQYGIRGAEIISADSRQVYKGLTIGTGKITRKEMHGVPHHCLDIAPPNRQLSVALYQKRAEQAIHATLASGKIPILVGGSGMYIDAVLYGAPYPNVPPNKRLRRRLEKKSPEALFTLLQKKDPARAKTVDRHNKRRLIRALEIIEATKKPVPPLKKIPRYDALFLGIQRSRSELYRRIDVRLARRMRHGMIAEAKKLLASGVSRKRLWELGLEYRYLAEYLQRHLTKKEMAEKLSLAIKHYAKRQETWFRQYPRTRWIRTEQEVLRCIRAWLPRK